ncbi:iron-containing alcohol dehydrogenase [Cohaesibacter celericrescens]|uniref:iron-containing alcohol dehydrogenase n=1 Tax=Cohaesibacter celericrescens TaxID=2067669 RepID=UPI0035651B1F
MKSLSSPILLRLPSAMLFGQGQAARLAELMPQMQNDKFFIVTDSFNAKRVANLGLSLSNEQIGIVDPEPDLNCLNAALAQARAGQYEVIVGFGGGSAMDCAKLIAVLLGNQLSLSDIAGKGNAPSRQCQLVQIPTTAGTGSEAGARALITDPESAVKIATDSEFMVADYILIDPDLTLTAPLDVTLATGVDALAHCVEAFTSKIAHPLIDWYAQRGIELIGENLPKLVSNLADQEARTALCLAAYYGGICLGPVNTTAGHALAYPLSTHYKIPHGAANALIFPYTLAYNSSAQSEKTRIVLESLGLGQATSEEDIRIRSAELLRSYGLKTKLSDFNIPEHTLELMAGEASTIRRLLDNNPRNIGAKEILEIYQAAY